MFYNNYDYTNFLEYLSNTTSKKHIFLINACQIF